MKFSLKRDSLELLDEQISSKTRLYVGYCGEFDTIDLSTTIQGSDEQHDISLSIKDWVFVKNFVDQKIKEVENDTEI